MHGGNGAPTAQQLLDTILRGCFEGGHDKEHAVAITSAMHCRQLEVRRLRHDLRQAEAKIQELERMIFCRSPSPLAPPKVVNGAPAKAPGGWRPTPREFAPDPPEFSARWVSTVEYLRDAFADNPAAKQALELYVEGGIRGQEALIKELRDRLDAALRTRDERAELIAEMMATARASVVCEKQTVSKLERQLAEARKAAQDAQKLAEEHAAGLAELQAECRTMKADLATAERRADAWSRRVAELEQSATWTVQQLMEYQRQELRLQELRLQELRARPEPKRARAQQPPPGQHMLQYAATATQQAARRAAQQAAQQAVQTPPPLPALTLASCHDGSPLGRRP